MQITWHSSFLFSHTATIQVLFDRWVQLLSIVCLSNCILVLNIASTVNVTTFQKISYFVSGTIWKKHVSAIKVCVCHGIKPLQTNIVMYSNLSVCLCVCLVWLGAVCFFVRYIYYGTMIIIIIFNADFLDSFAHEQTRMWYFCMRWRKN